ncbi:glycosyltransferase family 2 protein [Spirosoma rhododendri]|uniref:Glycosyltransferase family 2 protein n=1 Tax=Spirosoma rhododendri TaxID=2728024 RepID=A0A7L5DNZ3_9BACT|nr:glycosyltransferase family 2 protein [Spirosoma rhododendri]QJD79282.1 glycosyltransferase family 2 protein [Spirosoma rhododendri]
MAEGERLTSPVPLVSIITINYNQAEVTRQFLDSSRLLTHPNVEIIVVDNASQPSLNSCLDAGQYPNVRVIRSDENLGFTGGNNLGIANANGEYLFIVNNDTELNADLLTELLKPFAADDRIGVTCPKIRFFSNPSLVQYAGYNPMNMLTGTAVPVGYKLPDDASYDQPGPTAFAHGCAMLVKRAVIDKVGRFAERFFLYYEELDWSQRIRDAGFVIYYQPSAHILHKESMSVGEFSPLKTYYLTRNRILFMRRHCTPVQKLVFYLFFAGCVVPKHLATYVLSGKRQHAQAFVRGVWWNLHSASTSPV